jgi:pre-mRNA-splicing factor CWC22
MLESCGFISSKLMPPFQTACHSTTRFIAHLVNQGVAHDLIALQILFLIERPTDNSIEIAVVFTREDRSFLQETSPNADATASAPC